jgi:hypothetical protein
MIDNRQSMADWLPDRTRVRLFAAIHNFSLCLLIYTKNRTYILVFLAKITPKSPPIDPWTMRTQVTFRFFRNLFRTLKSDSQGILRSDEKRQFIMKCLGQA